MEEFLEREKRRQKALEVRDASSPPITWLILHKDAAKPKALKRDEWMLVPPSKSDLLGCTLKWHRVPVFEEGSRWCESKQLLIQHG